MPSHDVVASGSLTRGQRVGAIKRGELIRVAPGLDIWRRGRPVDVALAMNQWDIVAAMVPNGVVSHRTALDLEPAADGMLVVTDPRIRKDAPIRRWPGRVLRRVTGAGALPGDTPLRDGLWRARPVRAWLECLSPSRRTTTAPRGLLRSALEDAIARWSDRMSTTALAAERHALAGTAHALGVDDNVARELATIIDALLSGNRDALRGDFARIWTRGSSVDATRIDRFRGVRDALRSDVRLAAMQAESTARVGPDPAPAGGPRQVLDFFDAYCSNWIEGTEFEVDEARRIVFDGYEPPKRPLDARDVLATFTALQQLPTLSTLGGAAPVSVIGAMREIHRAIMRHRPEVAPGEYKDRPNRAGQTEFVVPQAVEGTLLEGFALVSDEPDSWVRAVLAMFVVAEVHPFVDGNGRTARALLTHELRSAGMARVIIPPVYRTDYLVALRAASRTDTFEPYARMMRRAAAFVAAIPWSSFDVAHDALRASGALDEPDGGRRLRLPGELPGWGGRP
jgi:fido (protein-threonine AMPylation protein)